MSKDRQNNQNSDELAEKVKAAQAEANAEKAHQEKEMDEMETLQNELEKMTELAKRTMADLQNLKRRQQEESKSVYLMANISLIKSLLPVLDSFEKALKHQPTEAKEWCEGITMTINQFRNSLTQAGLKEIEAQDQEFNPDLHEALLEAPGKNNMVVEVLEKGYRLGEKVVRHAKVSVGNGQ